MENSWLSEMFIQIKFRVLVLNLKALNPIKFRSADEIGIRIYPTNPNNLFPLDNSLDEYSYRITLRPKENRLKMR